jgi:hypothetical protein
VAVPLPFRAFRYLSVAFLLVGSDESDDPKFSFSASDA